MLCTEYIWDIDDKWQNFDYGLESPSFNIDDDNSVWGLKLQLRLLSEDLGQEHKQDADLYLILYELQESAINIMYKLSVTDMRTGDPSAITDTYDGEAFFQKDKYVTIKGIPIWINDAPEETDEVMSLKIKCEITVITKAPCAFVNHTDSLRNDFDTLQKDRKFNDVVLVSRDKQRFPAHKCVLASRSPVFASMFEHNMTESQSGVVEIGDIDAETLARFLDYVYAGKLENLEVGPMSELLIAADKYAIDLMKVKIEELLVDRLDVYNVLDMLLIAAAHGALVLRARAIMFVVEKGRMVIKTPKFEDLQKSHPDLAIEILKCKWC